MSTLDGRVTTCENNTIIGGSYADNVLSLTQQGGGTVDIPFEGSNYPVLIGTRTVAVSSISLEASSTSSGTFRAGNVHLNSNQCPIPFITVTPEYSVYFKGGDTTPDIDRYYSRIHYPFEFTANNKQAVLDALSECVSYCNSTGFRIVIAPIREDRQTIDGLTDWRYISVQVTEVTDNKISDISLEGSSIFFTESGYHPLNYVSIYNVSYIA